MNVPSCQFSIHNFPIEKFVKLAPGMDCVRRWNKRGVFYYSGSIEAGEQEITFFTEDMPAPIPELARIAEVCK
jgi:hypothetical protein